MLLSFGKYKGKPLSDVPTDYLEWVCRTNAQTESYFKGIEHITDELKRRKGSLFLPTTLEITDHAMDRAALRLHRIYKERRKQDEKMKVWLQRVFQYVLRYGQNRKSYTKRDGYKFKQPRYEYFLRDSIRGVEWKFVTEGNESYQKLITVFAPGYTDSGRKKA